MSEVSKKPRHRQQRSVASFDNYALPGPLVDELTAQGITEPFPIQAQTLPHTLAGQDILGRGRTGSGKTLAFVLPIVARLSANRVRAVSKSPRAIILAPTRELANQINAVLEPLATSVGLRTVTVYGGVSAVPQLNALRRGVDVVVACPGRLLDHHRSGALTFDRCEVAVIDEADHMADLGFLPDVRRILDAMPDGQRMLFSATLDRDVNVIVKKYLFDPVTVDVNPAGEDPNAHIDHHVLRINSAHRVAVIAELTKAGGRTVIFTRTRHGATKLAEQLGKSGVRTVELHGMLSQSARARNLESFSRGRSTTLVATDVAARGIHVDGVELVIHADPPAEHKAYLHRSGRTARAGARGTVITLATGAQLRSVRQLTKRADITPIETQVQPGDSLLEQLAPVVVESRAVAAPAEQPAKPRSRKGWAKAKPQTKRGGQQRTRNAKSGALGRSEEYSARSSSRTDSRSSGNADARTDHRGEADRSARSSSRPASARSASDRPANSRSASGKRSKFDDRPEGANRGRQNKSGRNGRAGETSDQRRARRERSHARTA